MKNSFSRPSFIFIVSFFVFFSSCKKINESTTLGGDLVPEVDNINTFESTFATETDNVSMPDTARLIYTDAVALGTITNDPEFGKTTASVSFQINPLAYGTYPFTSKEVQIDSVVLSLDYIGHYGDTTIPQTVRVYEIANTASFNDTTYYQFNHPEFETSREIGSATFNMMRMKDSVGLIRKGDTVYTANQLRITLDNEIGARLASFDTTTGLNGGYRNDTLFKTLFRGLLVKSDEGTGNALGYFSLSNAAKTNLTVYYRAAKNGAIDTAQTTFTHALRITYRTNTSKGGQVNTVKREAAGGWNTYLHNSTAQDDKIYIQSQPGSAGFITIPGLDTFSNKLIHRAELIATRLPSAMENFFTPTDQLFVDKVSATDSVYLLQEHVTTSSTTGLPVFNFGSFGGNLRADNTYRFNVTSAVQDIIARDSANLRLRIYAPFDTRPFDSRTRPAVPLFVQAIPFVAYSRVVLAGGDHPDPAMKLRLRVIYSNL